MLRISIKTASSSSKRPTEARTARGGHRQTARCGMEADMQTRRSEPDGLAAAQHLLTCESCLHLMAFAFEEHDLDTLRAWERQLRKHLKAERGRVLQ